ncbi:MAG: hypothetical protein CMH57_00470 [Myxococcales bacterium]|nr:hypothetical protein [Myxococcales bacterium]
MGLMGLTTAHADGSMQGMDLMEEVSLDRFAYLKRLSLDLRGRVPTFDEYMALESQPDVSEADIDAMLDSDGFLDVMEAYHRDLLWANVGNIDFVNFNWDLQRATVSGTQVWYLRRRSYLYRGTPQDNNSASIPCGDWEQTEWNADGTPVAQVGEDGRRREGWVWVEPYWSMGDPSMESPIRVCAWDAQESEVSTNGVACSSRRSSTEITCGCGPNLNWCGGVSGVNTEVTVGEQINDQMLQVIRWVIESDRPYHEILTTNRSFVNGPLVHYYTYQSDLASNVSLSPAPVDPIFLPQVEFNDYRWHEVIQGPEHSGILTSMNFLLRFQTNRARVNRFYNAFLNSFFDASKGTDTEHCTDAGANLKDRCECGKCHQNVEPWAAYWGRFKEQGAGYLDPAMFPDYNELCERCATDPSLGCSTECRENYVVETVPADHIPYLGQLKPLEFLTESERLNLEGGPQLWVERSLYDGSLARGVVAKMWGRFMQRDFTGGKADTEIRDELFRAFVNNDYNVKALVKAIVTHPAYRRIR